MMLVTGWLTSSETSLTRMNWLKDCIPLSTRIKKYSLCSLCGNNMPSLCTCAQGSNNFSNLYVVLLHTLLSTGAAERLSAHAWCNFHAAPPVFRKPCDRAITLLPWQLSTEICEWPGSCGRLGRRNGCPKSQNRLTSSSGFSL